jgi:hypothetical protein
MGVVTQEFQLTASRKSWHNDNTASSKTNNRDTIQHVVVTTERGHSRMHGSGGYLSYSRVQQYCTTTLSSIGRYSKITPESAG